MAFKEMRFKGRRVFVEVDENGKPRVEAGRATMKYRIGDERVYRPGLGNLQEIGEAGIEGQGVIAYTDGACSGNPGPAGLGYVILFPNGGRVQRGEPLGPATNNIAELTAIQRVLDQIDHTADSVTIYTDSEYAIGVLTRGWKAKANQELIERIKKAMARFPRLKLEKVPGHAGVAENELVDDLARKAAETQTMVRE
jgi:ribonuclease HI